MEKLPSMGKGSKKKTPATKKRETPPVVGAQLHGREASNGEAERIARGRKLVIGLLVRRDGMTEEIASAVVDGMEPETINALIAEANSTVLDRLKKGEPAPGAASAPASLDAPATEEQGVALVAPPTHVDFLSVPSLASSEDIVALTYALPGLAKAKSEAEAKYKAEKAKIIQQVRAGGVLKVTVTDWKVTVFEGGNSYIDEIALIEAGVDQAIINKCKKRTPFWDVKVTPPAPPKPEGGQ